VKTPSHVRAIVGDEVRIETSEPAHGQLLRELGARRSFVGGYFTLLCQDPVSLMEALLALRDAGFAFAAAPHGWPPAAIFEQMRDDGLVDGPFLEITWGTGGPEVRTNPAPTG